MKKVPIEVHRTSAGSAHFIIPDHLDPQEVLGIVESVMEQLMLESLKTTTVSYTDAAPCDWNYKHNGD